MTCGNTVVELRGWKPKLARLRLVRWRTFAKFPRGPYRSMVHHGELIRQLRGDGQIAQLADRAGMTEARWRQIETVGGGPAQTIYRMGIALGVTGSQLEELFRLAGFADVFDGLTRLGARQQRPSIPASAEVGVTGDMTLTPEDREDILRYIADRRELAEVRSKRGESEGA